MQIAGFVKNSFVDYPGHIAATVFVPGCNMDCWYCHNQPLWQADSLIGFNDVAAFLEKRRGFLSGVVITGGEPTLQSGLGSFIDHVRGLGLRVKLDTNGLRPDTVAALLDKLDYIALDLKAPPGELSRVVSFDLNDAPIWQTADLLMKSDVGYEFRTTFMPFLDVSDITVIAQRIKGAKKYVLSQYRRPEGLAFSPEPHSPDILKEAAAAARQYLQDVQLRGV